jgi:hypothetical protein
VATYVQNFPDEVIANGGYEEVKGPPKTVDADEAPKDQEPSALRIRYLRLQSMEKTLKTLMKTSTPSHPIDIFTCC